MEEFQTYSPEEIILSNLEELFYRGLHIGEQEVAHLRELAREIAAEVEDNQTLLTSLPDHRLPSPTELIDREITRGDLRTALSNQLSTRQKTLFCIEISQRIPSPDVFFQDLFPQGEELSEFSRNRISYQKNSYTELAFQKFSRLLQGVVRASYAQSFPSVCEDVFNGACEYCILPIENSAEGRLVSFANLIAQYDLKIAATCDVKVGEDKTTRFALLRRHAAPLQEADGFTHLFEFSCDLSQEQEADDLLSAARLCGLASQYVALRPVEGQRKLHGVFDADAGNLYAYLIYLAMEFPSANLIGHYPNIS